MSMEFDIQDLMQDIAARKRAQINRRFEIGAVVFVVIGVVALLVSGGTEALAGGARTVFGFACLAVVIAIYFLPALVASKRGHRQATAIGVLNLFLGWTFIGWVVALVWANTN